jgi:succinoglycan biosynthesis transport protein ExoP
MHDLAPHTLRPHFREAIGRDPYEDHFSDLPAFEEPEEPGLDFEKYWSIARNHLSLILTLFSLTFLFFACRTFAETPLYTAETVLLVKQRVPDMLSKPEEGSFVDENYSDNYYKTQNSILESRSLAATVVRDLDLGHDRVFLGEQQSIPALKQLQNLIVSRSGIGPVLEAMDDELGKLRRFLSGTANREVESTVANGNGDEVNPGLVARYLSMLSVSMEPGTSLVRIAFSTPDPELSSRLANAHAQAYAQLGIDLHNQADQAAERFLESRLIELRGQLEKSEIALNDYRRANGIVPGLMTLDGEETVVVDRLRDLSKELTEAELDRIGLEAQIELIKKKQYNSLPAVQTNGAIQSLQQSLNGLYADVASYSNQFKPDYPPLAELDAKAEQTRENLDREIARVVASIESGYQVALGKESELRAEMDKQKMTALGLNDAAVKYAMLQREVDTNRELTNNVLQKMKNVGFEAESEFSNVSVIDRAEIPSVPSSPRKIKALMTGALVGMVLGYLLAFGLEFLKRTFTTFEELEKFLRLPNLGIVPEFLHIGKRIEATEATANLPEPALKSQSTELVSEFDTFSIISEAYRFIRTGLLLSKAGSPPKLTLFTSAIRGEGKTVTAINTAIMLAHSGARVLLVDADLRRGRCHRVLGIDQSPGLTELLIGAGDDVSRFIRTTPNRGLFALTSGAIPPNSTELVGSQRMRQLLLDFSREYDFVVIDSPPLLPVSDAVILSNMVEGAVLVIDIARTPKKQIKAARTRLAHARAKIFGFVINRMSARNVRDYYYYAHYYESDAG